MSAVGASGTALITGVTGQDGYYLSQLLQRNGIEVHGVPRAVLTDAKALVQLIAVVNASSCEIFAGAADSPQTEATALQPISPYGASKAFGHLMCQVYRTKGLEVSNAILYNHESPRRPEGFVTRKITKAAAAIAVGRQDRLVLGDMTVERDWGWSPEYVDAMYRMALHGKGDDFVVATGVTHSVGDFVAAAFATAGIQDWQSHVETDEQFLRPRDQAVMAGDATKAGAVLGWHPRFGFDEIINAMVSSDLRQEQDACGENPRSRTRRISPASSKSLLI